MTILLTQVFPYFVNKIFVFNPDERFDSTIYKFKTKLLQESPILEIVTKEMISKVMKEEFNLDSIEKKYGGNFRDLEDYWPPRTFSNATKTLDDESMLYQGIEPFCFNCEQVLEYKLSLIHI